MPSWLNKLNLIFFVSIITVILIAVGIIPREATFFLLGLQVFYVIFSSLEESLSLFVRLIPFFIALPLTESFDNFNSWRILSLLIFFKWLWGTGLLANRLPSIRNVWKDNRFILLLILLFVFAAISLFSATHLFISVKKIIYFVNLLLVPIVIVQIIKQRSVFRESLAVDFFIATSLTILVGLLQQLSASFWPFAGFMSFWAQKVQLNFYGHQWAEIAASANTWFAYNLSDALKLRLFSTFPDSHSFPLFLLAALPFLVSWLVAKNRIWLPIYLFLYFLVLILTGTRGIWASVIFPIIFLIYHYFKGEDKQLLKKTLLMMSLFFVSFGAAYLILQQPQFMLKESASEEKASIIKRVSSIIDTGETSNAGRIKIWQKTIDSLIKKPLTGVGIGNFPLVLDESIDTARAGSSAHNLYLNVGAEMGVLAMIVFIWLFGEILQTANVLFRNKINAEVKLFGLVSIISLLWIYAYNMTDAALFDERAFLAFAVLVATILGLASANKPHHPTNG